MLSSFKLLVGCALVLSLGLLESLSRAGSTGQAQGQVGSSSGITMCNPADGATVAWVARSSDGTKEFWAYIDGEFQFASSSHTASNPWNLRGVYDANLPTGGFEAFRTEVLSRAAAQDKTIIFHNMTVAESVTEN